MIGWGIKVEITVNELKIILYVNNSIIKQLVQCSLTCPNTKITFKALKRLLSKKGS